MNGEMALAVSIAFLSFSAPATAAIIARARNSKTVDLNGKYVQTREYDAFKSDLKDRLDGIERMQSQTLELLKSRLR